MITCGTDDTTAIDMSCDRFDGMWYNKTSVEPVGTPNRAGMAATYQKTVNGVKAFFLGGSTAANQLMPTMDIVPSVDATTASGWGKGADMALALRYSTATWVDSPVNGIVVLGGQDATLAFPALKFVLESPNTPKSAINGTSGSNPSGPKTPGDAPNNPDSEPKPPTNITLIVVICVSSVVLVIVIVVMAVNRTLPNPGAEVVKEKESPVPTFTEEEKARQANAYLGYIPPPRFSPSNKGQDNIDLVGGFIPRPNIQNPHAPQSRGDPRRRPQYDVAPQEPQYVTDTQDPQYCANSRSYRFDIPGPEYGADLRGPPQHDVDPLMFQYGVDPCDPHEHIPVPRYEVNPRAPQFGEHIPVPRYEADPRAPQYGEHASVRRHEVDPRAPQFGKDPGTEFRYSVAICAPHRVKTMFGTETQGHFAESRRVE
ncbi:hypothetical protein BGX31_000139 [Mortierella sp. GBA43]|nr:hypothetical protein BGX31_000139 [Mortierella sp. GBA43]